MITAEKIVANALHSRPTVKKQDICGSQYYNLMRSRVKTAYEKILASNDSPLRDLVRSRSSRLDNNVLMDHSTLREWYKEVHDAEALNEFAKVDLTTPKSEKKNAVYLNAAMRAAEARAEGTRFRILEEFTDDVAPVFWTLTVDAQHEYIISKGRRELRDWLKKVTRKFGKFKYTAVVERGEQTGRLHWHLLVLFETGTQFTDPNRGRKNGKKREIPELKGFWPYGMIQNPIAIRNSPMDYWGRLGWMWPKGTTANPKECIADYMAKYIRKMPEEDVNGCRTRMTRGFGTMILDKMTISQAVQVTLGHCDKISKELGLKTKPPKLLLHRHAQKRLYGNLPPLPLPIAKVGSIAEAAGKVTDEKLSQTRCGDSINRSDGFEGELNQWAPDRTNPLRIGEIT